MSVLKRTSAPIAALAVLVVSGISFYFLLGNPGDDPGREPGSPAAVQLETSEEPNARPVGGVPVDPAGRTRPVAGVGHEESAHPPGPEESGLVGQVNSIDPALRPPFSISLAALGHEATPPEVPEVQTDGAGNFDLGAVDPGNWRLLVHPGAPPMAESHQLPDPLSLALASAVDSGQWSPLATLELELRPGEVRRLEITVGRPASDSAHLLGFVVGDSSAEFEFEVRLSSVDEHGERFRSMREPGGDGFFDFGFVPPGLTRLTLLGEPAPGRGPFLLAELELDLLPGEFREVELEVPLPCYITLEALDATTNHPLSGATLSLFNQASLVSSTFFGVPDQPPALRSGPYLLVATAEGYRIAVERFEVLEGERAALVRVRLYPSKSTPVTLVNLEGESLRDVNIQIMQFAGESLPASMYPTTQTDSSGSFDSGFLPPDTYTALVTHRGGETPRLERGLLVVTGNPGTIVFSPSE